jgi:GDP/UDP-N,N'-diacetylbacillosamine 2-epimerase (hydrolysing)
MGLGMIGFADVFNDLQPDLIVVLGDRFEIFSAVSAAMIAKIPVAHLHGGEATEGLIDEPIRHSVTKMSHLHFTAIKEYKDRVIQLGEQPNRVFNVGGLGIDNIKKLQLLSRVDFEKSIKFKLNKKNILITFHPVTLEESTAKEQFQELLDSVCELKDTNIIFTKANSDTNGRIINDMIDNYVSIHDNTIEFTSMGQLNYLSALQYMDAVVGNSSSGLAEAPSFNIATIDIGDRQKGRIKADSVISCLPNKKDIDRALNKLYSEDFQNIVGNVENPYGTGGASKEIVNIIKDFDLNDILKKSFYDLKGTS